jgi:hypothetical protein
VVYIRQSSPHQVLENRESRERQYALATLAEQFGWPTPIRILAMLRHPIYAGAYAYGFHRPGRKNPVSGQVEGGKWFLSPDEIRVLIQDRVPAYISWGQYLANQQRISENRSFPGSQGAARAGKALLSGLIVCGRCKHHMNVGYQPEKGKKPHYWCDTHLHEDREQPCFGLKAPPVDELVAQHVLRALEPAAVELSLQAATDSVSARRRGTSSRCGMRRPRHPRTARRLCVAWWNKSSFTSNSAASTWT